MTFVLYVRNTYNMNEQQLTQKEKNKRVKKIYDYLKKHEDELSTNNRLWAQARQVNGYIEKYGMIWKKFKIKDKKPNKTKKK